MVQHEGHQTLQRLRVSGITSDIHQLAGIVVQLKEQRRQSTVEVYELETVRAENGQVGFTQLEAQLALVTSWTDRIGQIDLREYVCPPS